MILIFCFYLIFVILQILYSDCIYLCRVTKILSVVENVNKLIQNIYEYYSV